jgi:hypothetical protein
MMKNGLLDEVKALLPFRTKPALLTVGYAELFDYLDGKQSLTEATEKSNKIRDVMPSDRLHGLKNMVIRIGFNPRRQPL